MSYIVFGTDQCPFCEKAADELENRGLKYKSVCFDDSQKTVLKEIKDAYEWKTVPMIFQREGNNIQFIGGCNDLIKHLEQDEG